MTTPNMTQPSNKTSEGPKKSDLIREILSDPSVKTVNWQAIMAAGVLADVHIERNRLRKRLNYKDLGIHIVEEKQAQATAEMFDLGMKNLLPREVRQTFDRIDDRGRRCLEKYALKTRLGYFVPVTSYKQWREEMDEIEKAYFAARDEVFAEYDKLKARVESNYVKIAHVAYKHLSAVSPDALRDDERREFLFLRKALRQVRGLFPTKESIEASFKFEVETAYIDLTLLSGAGKGEVAEGLTGAELDEVAWEQQAAKERRKLMEEMNNDLVKRARAEKQKKIDDFLADVIRQVRAILYETCAGVLSTLSKNDGTMQGRSMLALKNLVANINQMKFFPDRDVETSMELIQKLMDGYKNPNPKLRTVSTSEIETTLQRIALVMRSTILPLGYEDREERDEALFTRAGISETPGQKEVREAREALGFTMPSWDASREDRNEDFAFAGVASTASEERVERSW